MERLCVILLCLQVLGSRGLPVTVDTESGRVRGAIKEFQGQDGSGQYFSFRGIPYAQPPVGDLVWRDPEPVSPWEGEVDGTNETALLDNLCMQPGFFFGKPFEVVGSLDCLYLSVYTTGVPSGDHGTDNLELKPVLFWIHGGGFSLGAGDLGSGPDYLLESGVILVTINYRLGPMGFLALEGRDDITGNQGLKDQLMALRWVKKNIANFGGDPNRITIAGESAGAISVHAHVLSPLGKDENLFHSAIAFSGTMLMGGDIWDDVIGQNTEFFELHCGCIDCEDEDGGKCMEKSYEDLVQIVGEQNAWSTSVDLMMDEYATGNKKLYAFWPMVDYTSPEPFLPAHPITILHNKQQKMVPFMTGVNKDEGAMLTAGQWKNMDPENNKLQDNWDALSSQQIFMSGFNKTFDERLLAQIFTKFYLGGPEGVTRENKWNMNDMFTDAYFAFPNTEAVKLHAQSPAPVYNYLMTYRGTLSFSMFFGGGDEDAAKTDFGVAHADDMLYTFKTDSFMNMSSIVTDDDKRFLRKWQRVMTNFVKYANPTPVPTSGIPPWKEAQDSRAACVYMNLGNDFREEHRMFPERMELWNRIVFQKMLEKYAVSEEEDMLMVEIDSVIADVEGDDGDNYVEDHDDDDDDDSKEDSDEDDDKGKPKKGKGKKWKKRGRKHFKKMRRNSKEKHQKLRKRMRLAKKLRGLKCRH